MVVGTQRPGPGSQGRGGLFAALLRHWRTRRGLSQLDLALAAGVSGRHLSFLETGRSSPSVEMVLRLATALDVPLRHVNAMLRAADHPPWYPEPGREDQLPARVRSTLELMKRHHEPFPLIVVDHTYRVLDVNAAALAVLGAALPALATQDIGRLNLARLTLDPEAGGTVIANHPDVARELLWRMQREMLADPGNSGLRELLDVLLESSGVEEDWRRPDPTAPSAPTVELQLRVGEETWSFQLVVSTLQAPLEVALDEIRIEQWFPADDLTAAGCHALAHRPAEQGQGGGAARQVSPPMSSS